ncbi:MmgE/PrpD family protein [Streptomyces longispororuber]|uniref:MmgE/PrpD family protein n=1 Tax=Streptomyces longispororuber TaxID=68230 RepID=UPI00210CA980|nr:MmgE/PrpD family protein [Streptomyces longispororuber]MCQ4214066.1 MmgE/PrpD family protein [Streptomyces longispororuber]
MPYFAEELAAWAQSLDPSPADLRLAEHALEDTLAVSLAARGHRMADLAAALPEAARWAAVGHVLDFDDLHLPSTAHISVVCVPAVLAAGGGPREYLAAAGVMARLGVALGWRHYTGGWHATCTSGAPAAAVGAGLALGLDAEGLARAIALALPAAGGVQRAFGTDTKSLQVGFAAEAGVRAARLAAAGAGADPSALDAWLPLVGGDRALLPADTFAPGAPAVPGGLATKIFPCCYAMQRPIGAVRALLAERAISSADVVRIVVRTPEAAVHPLIHARPDTGLQGKFSLEYAIAAALLDGHPGFASFTDEQVRRPDARRLVELVEVVTSPAGAGLLTGATTVEITTIDGSTHTATLALPPGSSELPATETEFAGKLADCGADVPDLLHLPGLLDGPDWKSAAELLRAAFPAAPHPLEHA